MCWTRLRPVHAKDSAHLELVMLSFAVFVSSLFMCACRRVCVYNVLLTKS